MASSYGETVLDFDLNFLHPPSNTTVINSRLDKQRKAILIVKKKTIATDSLIRKYYAKRDVLDQTEKNLQTSKEECKQICIDYRKSLETCTKLENDIQILQHANKELEERCFNAENQFEAVKSHANQLQLLVKQHETNIEALTIEKKIAKTNSKERNDKRLSSVQKENYELISHICLVRDIIFGKKKLSEKHKLLLRKYDKYKSKDVDSESKEEYSGEENDFYEDTPMSPFYENEDNSTEKDYEKAPISSTTCEVIQLTNIETDKISRNPVTKRDEIDNSSDLVSIDTGRGSSLAFSDNDKCFHSPDYYSNDSPLSDSSIVNKQRRKLVDVSTSPIPVYESVHRATSPIAFKDIIPPNADYNNIKRVDVGISTDILGSPNITNKHSLCMVNRAVSPIKLNTYKETSTSPIRHVSAEVAMSPIKINNKVHPINKSQKTLQEEECLELNNSNNLCDDNDSDCEIEMILNTMRMHQALITPIPATPAKPGCTETIRASSITSKPTEQSRSYVCQDAALVREENKKLHVSIAELAKEIVNIKSMLINQVPMTTQEQQQNSQLDEELCTDDNDNDLIIIDPNRNSISSPNRSSHSEPNTKRKKLTFTEKLKHKENHDNSLLNTAHILQACSTSSPVPNDAIGDDDITSTDGENNSSLGRLQFEDATQYPNECNSETRELREKTDDVEGAIQCSENNNLLNDNQYKLVKARKLTRLGKLKLGLQPKCKIRRALPVKRLRVKPKKIILPKKKRVTEADSCATLNDKTVYDKALKIMSELKSKQNSKGIIDSNKYSKTVTVSAKKKDTTEKSVKDAKHTANEKKNYDSVDDKKPNQSQNISVKTRSRNKRNSQTDVKTNEWENQHKSDSEVTKDRDNKNNRKLELQESRKRLKRTSIDETEVPCKRILRSSTALPTTVNHNTTIQKSPELKILQVVVHRDAFLADIKKDQNQSVSKTSKDVNLTKQLSDNKIVNKHCDQSQPPLLENTKQITNNPKESVLCAMIEKYGVKSVYFSSRKVPETLINTISKKIEDHIGNIIELPAKETKAAMNLFVEDAQKWKIKPFLAGLMNYLKEPARKTELFSKTSTPPAPSMTKPEQVLLYVVTELKTLWPTADIVNKVLINIEYALFALNRSPQFDVIESMSHFYAVVCRYFKLKSRLRLFIMDAMYCLQFKSVPLIKQCIDVWMHILPLAHMGIAKSPLVTCLVYLLHFYKCEDKFKRVQEIRHVLSRKYFYEITEWTESKIIDMLRNSIKELRGISIEKKMLRMALIIIAKRQGPLWCQNNLIKNLLLPLIVKDNVSDTIKEFCASMLGPLLKPYPDEMKVHCEIVIDQLVNILGQNPPHIVAEGIVKSLIIMNRHNQYRVLQALVTWRARETTPELNEIFRDFVRSKPIKSWIAILSKIAQFK